ncbi:MAG: hypothetical protein ABI821_14945 [Pseudomonadota bacterium]
MSDPENHPQAVAVLEERAQDQSALREQSRMLAILNRTGQSLASQLDRLLQTVTDSATTLSGARFGAFCYNRVNEQGEDYLLYSLPGEPREAFEQFGHPRATAVFAPMLIDSGIGIGITRRTARGWATAASSPCICPRGCMA